MGMVIDVRPLHPEKAYSPIYVTLLGIVTEVRSLQLEKARSRMPDTLLGIIVFLHPKYIVFDEVIIMALQSLRESK